MQCTAFFCAFKRVLSGAVFSSFCQDQIISLPQSTMFKDTKNLRIEFYPKIDDFGERKDLLPSGHDLLDLAFLLQTFFVNQNEDHCNYRLLPHRRTILRSCMSSLVAKVERRKKFNFLASLGKCVLRPQCMRRHLQRFEFNGF